VKSTGATNIACTPRARSLTFPASRRVFLGEFQDSRRLLAPRARGGRRPRRCLSRPQPEDLGDCPGKIVVTVHDLVYKTYPAGHTEETCATADRQLKEIVARADKIICCSRATLTDLKTFFSVDERKTCCIPQGVDQQLFYPLSEESRGQAVQRWRGWGSSSVYFICRHPGAAQEFRQSARGFCPAQGAEEIRGLLVCAGMRGGAATMGDSVCGI